MLYAKELRVKRSALCTATLPWSYLHNVGLAFTKCNLFFSRNHCNTSQCPMHLSRAKQHVHSTSHPHHKSLLSYVGQSKVIAQVYSTLQASFSNRQCFFFLKRLGKRIFRSQFFLAGKILTRPTHWWWEMLPVIKKKLAMWWLHEDGIFYRADGVHLVSDTAFVVC